VVLATTDDPDIGQDDQIVIAADLLEGTGQMLARILA